ncbi:tetratricopeptide repeat protein [Leptospira sp. 'Mane']|uniref:tetratricopeptide repeat protein n=1 Tax=Leptospira sp. 'Mane' TaxID=3387407 RepID=UPI00398ACF1E
MKGFGIFLFSVFIIYSCSAPNKNPTTDPYSLETLGFLEEVLLDVWEGADAREDALSRLRYVCRNKDTDDGFLCYTWGLLEYRRGNYNESYTAFKKALEKNPYDTLYKNMLRLSAENSDNLDDMSKTFEEGKTLASYSKAIRSCQEEYRHKDAFPSVLFLAKDGHLTKDMLRKGVFSNCYLGFSDSEKAEILPYIKTARSVYSDKLLNDQVKTDPFSRVWDTGVYHKPGEAKEGVVSSHPLTESWRKIRSAAGTGNETGAREALKQFLGEIQILKKKGKKEADLCLALERSAKLLIDQDPAYSKIRFLSKEF